MIVDARLASGSARSIFRKLGELFEEQERLRTVFVFKSESCFQTRVLSDQRSNSLHVFDPVLDVPIVFIAEDHHDTARVRTFLLEAHPDQRKELLFFARARFTIDHLQTRRAKLIALTEVVKKTLPTILLDKT